MLGRERVVFISPQNRFRGVAVRFCREPCLWKVLST